MNITIPGQVVKLQLVKDKKSQATTQCETYGEIIRISIEHISATPLTPTLIHGYYIIWFKNCQCKNSLVQ